MYFSVQSEMMQTHRECGKVTKNDRFIIAQDAEFVQRIFKISSNKIHISLRPDKKICRGAFASYGALQEIGLNQLAVREQEGLDLIF